MLCYMLSLLRGVCHFHCKKKKKVKMELKRLEDLDLIRLVCTDSRCAKREQRRYPVV